MELPSRATTALAIAAVSMSAAIVGVARDAVSSPMVDLGGAVRSDGTPGDETRLIAGKGAVPLGAAVAGYYGSLVVIPTIASLVQAGHATGEDPVPADARTGTLGAVAIAVTTTPGRPLSLTQIDRTGAWLASAPVAGRVGDRGAADRVPDQDAASDPSGDPDGGGIDTPPSPPEVSAPSQPASRPTGRPMPTERPRKRLAPAELRPSSVATWPSIASTAPAQRRPTTAPTTPDPAAIDSRPAATEPARPEAGATGGPDGASTD